MAAINLKGTTDIFPNDTSAVDTVQQLPVGTRAWDKDGNEYVYGLGVVSTVAGDWVSFNHLWASARLAAGAIGKVGVAMAAIVASNWGWYQVYGKATGNSDAIATNAVMYIDATAGRVDDSAVTGDLVLGAYSRSTDASTNSATFELDYPQVTTKIG